MYIECANQGRPTSEITPPAANGTNALPVLSNGEEVKGVGSLLVTGNIHEVMKESCQLAYTYAKYITSTFFNNHYL